MNYYILMCIYISPKYNLLSPYYVACMYVFRVTCIICWLTTHFLCITLNSWSFGFSWIVSPYSSAKIHVFILLSQSLMLSMNKVGKVNIHTRSCFIIWNPLRQLKIIFPCKTTFSNHIYILFIVYSHSH